MVAATRLKELELRGTVYRMPDTERTPQRDDASPFKMTMTMRIVAIKDGTTETLPPRVEAMFQLIMEHHAKDISSTRQGWLEIHWDGKKVHSHVKLHGGVRTIDVVNKDT